MTQDAPERHYTDVDHNLAEPRQRAVIGAVALVNELISGPALDDLESLVATMEYALNFGVYFAPSEWIRGSESTREVLTVLRPLVQYRRLVMESRAKIAMEGGAGGGIGG